MDLEQVDAVAVGGVGGSGTRVVASALQRAGWFLGDDLNAARDNLWFTLLFKYPGVLELPDDEFDELLELFVGRMVGGEVDGPGAEAAIGALAARRCEQHAPGWLAERAATFSRRALAAEAPTRRWGWKEPNTHLVLDRLAVRMPRLRYVHVVRSGLDMAVGSNQNQARMWGDALGAPFDGSASSSLRFWCAAQRRVFGLAAAMPGRFMWVRFEDLCAEPERELARVLEFCGAHGATEVARDLAGEVHPPDSLGRGVRCLDRIRPDRTDLDYLASLGFDTTTQRALGPG